MKIRYRMLPQRIFPLLVLVVCIVLTQSPTRAVEYQEDVSNAEYSYVKGMIRSISLEQGAITVKPREGHSITVLVDAKTELEGFYKLEELKVRQQIKVWYRPEKDRNIALKILKPLDLGC